MYAESVYRVGAVREHELCVAGDVEIENESARLWLRGVAAVPLPVVITATFITRKHGARR